ncbi:multifunctional CCA addition/repair protein [Chitiniphilus eburneus]|uniref:CCA-adding enzyme n=1 Tax=Chitiniphilus eburneus TaxID=2571148 RepID=A0A4U0Q8L8_9NEIS|nr:multifunctional CCA addition/repair protein [Chitiniphilus eburneus]TJZ77633.1 multifunctional CCA addition/repair protein [Chitiniphilus eburneus]
MRIYKVGGVVRDRLLGFEVQDTDWVVVGADAAQMEAAGFRPVGKDFPVFLHPRTQEEYALARTERKNGRGYKGFTVFADASVTLEEDLARRDLTINAMAEDDHGQVIDPFNGQADLRAGVLRHVSPAFAEDPVRVLRLARFAARFGFVVAPETMALMQGMVADGEVDHLVPERVWQELARGMMERTPSRMFAVLRQCAALARIAPELDALWACSTATGSFMPNHGDQAMWVLDDCAGRNWPLPTRYAALCARLGEPCAEPARQIGAERIDSLSRRIRAPAECRDLAVITQRERPLVHQALSLDAEALMGLLGRTDALRKPARFDQLLDACATDLRSESGNADLPYPQASRLRQVRDIARAVDAGAVARACADPAQIPERVAQARRDAVASALEGMAGSPEA